MISRIRKAVAEDIYKTSKYHRAVWQKRPWTMVNVRVDFRGEVWEDFAFAKANWPDDWDSDYGVELATKKAIADIARSIVAQAFREGDIGGGWWSSYLASKGIEDVISAIGA